MLLIFILLFSQSAEGYNINDGIQLQRSIQVDEISLLAPSWYVSLDIQPYGTTVPTLTNVVHFTSNNEDNSAYGSRVPAIFFKENSRKLMLCSAVSKIKDHCFTTTEELPIDKYTHVEISQVQLKLKEGPLSGKFQLVTRVNGEIVDTVNNDEPRFFGNVKVYRSNPWYATPNALIKNFIYGNLPYKFKLPGKSIIKTIPILYEVFEVSLDIKPIGGRKQPPDVYRNILHLSKDGDKSQSGDRTPAIFFHPKSHRLHICSAVSGKKNYCVGTRSSISRDEYTTVKIKQYYTEDGGNKLKYKVVVGDVVLTDVVNTQRMQLENVKAHLSGAWHQTAEASIKNLVIKSNLGDAIIRPKQGSEVLHIPRIERQFYLSFDLKPVATVNVLSNILHLTKGGDQGQAGDRVPGVYFVPGTTTLRICDNTASTANCIDSPQQLTLNHYVNIRIRQTWDVASGHHKLFIAFGGVEIFNTINEPTQEFENMFLYVSDPWSHPANVEIKNLVFKNLPYGYTYSQCNGARAEDGIDCSEYKELSGFRSIEGVCNNLQNPTWGSSHIELRRVVDPKYASDGKFDTPRGFPNTNPVLPPPNDVTQQLFEVENENSGSTKKLTTLFMTFGQFLDHDITETPHEPCGQTCDTTNSWQYPCFPLLFDTTTNKCSANGRSDSVCSTRAYLSPRQQMNGLSAFIDGSQIYSNVKTHFALSRDDTDGLMKITAGLLPIENAEGVNGCFTKGGCSLTGDARADENMALHSMHTLWIRNHNFIARQLKTHNPGWDHDTLFNNARKINSAIWQHITYEEYVPVLAKLPPYQGYKDDVDPSITNIFASAAFRYGHSLVPNEFDQLDKGFNKENEPVPLQDAFFNRQFINDRGIEQTMRGLIGNMSNNVDNKFSNAIARKLFLAVGAAGYLDLTALNIQRGRDHGLPGYNTYRNYCNLPVAENWADIDNFMVSGAGTKLSMVYKHPDDIDIFAGGISEKHVKDFEIGPTFNCLIDQQFKATRDGDRFYYENPGVFKQSQLEAIKKVTMSTILCINLNSPNQPIGLVSVQPDALYTSDVVGNTRKSCTGDAIPKLDLTPWKESAKDKNVGDLPGSSNSMPPPDEKIYQKKSHSKKNKKKHGSSKDVLLSKIADLLRRERKQEEEEDLLQDLEDYQEHADSYRSSHHHRHFHQNDHPRHHHHHHHHNDVKPQHQNHPTHHSKKSLLQRFKDYAKSKKDFYDDDRTATTNTDDFDRNDDDEDFNDNEQQFDDEEVAIHEFVKSGREKQDENLLQSLQKNLENYYD